MSIYLKGLSMNFFLMYVSEVSEYVNFFPFFYYTCQLICSILLMFILIHIVYCVLNTNNFSISTSSSIMILITYVIK